MNYTDQFFQIRVFKFFTSATKLRFKVLKIKSHKMHNVDGKQFLHITTTYLLPPLKSMPSAMYFCMTDCSSPLLVLASSN